VNDKPEEPKTEEQPPSAADARAAIDPNANVTVFPKPPAGYKPRCIVYKCGAELKDGRKSRQFCGPCHSLLPTHLQRALRGEEEYLAARGSTGVGDQATMMLVTAAATRIFRLKLEGNPQLAEEHRKEVEEQMQKQNQARLEQASREAKQDGPDAKKLSVVP